MTKLLVVFVLATIFCAIVWADNQKGQQGDSESGTYQIAKGAKGSAYDGITEEQVKSESMRIVREASPHKGHYKGHNKGHDKGYKGKGHY